MSESTDKAKEAVKEIVREINAKEPTTIVGKTLKPKKD